jgi:DNA-binding PadR family transcriptional regulator
MPAELGLKTHWFYILLALAAGERHGLAIAREVRSLSEGQVRLWPATLYGSLDELRVRRWVEAIDSSERPDESERKRFYRITPPGRTVLSSETERLARLARLARSRVRPRAGETS